MCELVAMHSEVARHAKGGWENLYFIFLRHADFAITGALTALEMLMVKSHMDVPSGMNILLVEDEKDVRESVKLLLSIDRHTVSEAANAREALRLFAKSTYDLVISDYVMPEMNGDELARKIRNIAPTQPILMLTSYVEKLVATGTPLTNILAKPLDIELLRQAILRRMDPSTSTQLFYGGGHAGS